MNWRIHKLRADQSPERMHAFRRHRAAGVALGERPDVVAIHELAVRKRTREVEIAGDPVEGVRERAIVLESLDGLAALQHGFRHESRNRRAQEPLLLAQRDVVAARATEREFRDRGIEKGHRDRGAPLRQHGFIVQETRGWRDVFLEVALKALAAASAPIDRASRTCGGDGEVAVIGLLDELASKPGRRHALVARVGVKLAERTAQRRRRVIPQPQDAVTRHAAEDRVGAVPGEHEALAACGVPP